VEVWCVPSGTCLSCRPMWRSGVYHLLRVYHVGLMVTMWRSGVYHLLRVYHVGLCMGVNVFGIGVFVTLVFENVCIFLAPFQM
jgi:hypothetical protein